MRARNKAISLICALVAVVLIWALLSSWENMQVRFFQNALATHAINITVQLDGHNISFAQGKVSTLGLSKSENLRALRLAYAATLAARSPLFALPGTNPDDLRYATAQLRLQALELAALQTDTQLANLVRDNLYPVDFLDAAADAEAARVTFITNPREETMQEYDRALEQEVSLYRRTLDQFEHAARQALKPNMPPYVAAGKLVSRERILGGIQTLRSGFNGMDTVRVRRALCIRGVVYFCSTTDLKTPTIPEVPTHKLTEEEVRAAQENRDLYIESLRPGLEGEILRGAPVYALSKAVCAPDSPGSPTYVLAVGSSTPSIPARMRGVYVGDIRLIDIHKLATLPFYSDLQSRGVEYVLSPPLLHYECMDEVLDYSAIFSTQLVMDAEQQTPTVRYESDAIALANTLAQDGKSEHLSFALSFLYHSARMDRVARDIVWSERANSELVREGIAADLDATNLFFSRSGFVTLFMAHNRSFVGPDISLFEDASVPRSAYPYTYYSTLTSPVEKTQIIKDVKFYIQLHLDAIRKTL